MEHVKHLFDPVFDENSEIIILGTIPSPKSRETGFYYGHPRNRFWPVLADVLGEDRPVTIEDKREMALRRHIAVWDVCASCEIEGASDTSIKNPRPNDMHMILNKAKIRGIFTTGTKAAALYKRYCYPLTGIPSICLPSTSPANCQISYDELVKAYSQLKDFLLSPFIDK